MLNIKWPTVQELLADPSKYGSYFTRVGADGYSIYSRLKASNEMYGLAEAERNYGYAKTDVERAITRANEEVYNAMNNGAATDPNSNAAKTAKYYIDNARNLLSGLAPGLASEPLPSYEEMIGKPMQDPQGTQRVDASGKVTTPSTGFPAQSTGTSSTPGGNAATTGSNSPTQPTGSAAVDPADQNWINQLYQKYFDRNASSAELTNWSKESAPTLEQFLGKEAKKYGYTSKYFKTDSTQRLSSAMDIINNSDLPPDIKNMWSAVVQGYPSGMEYNASEILNTFNKIKTETIDPKFKELADIAKTDFQKAIGMQNASYELTKEAENANAGQDIRQAKAGLEKAGMTFTGKAIEQLGATSAYAQPGANPTSNVPTQEPFGGLFNEGTVNQANRLMASSSSLQNRANIDSLNRSLEKQLGSTAAGAAGANVTGGITGSLNEQQQGAYASSLNGIISNYQKKTQLNTNIT